MVRVQNGCMDWTPVIHVVRERLGDFLPRVGLVLGSGLGFFADERMRERIVIPYGEIPGFPRSTVAGHAGRFVAGKVGSVPVLCMQGRFHYYEGYDLATVALPIRLMAKLGVETVLLTNAAGGINTDFSPGDFMVIDDHINMLGNNPLRGSNEDSLGPRFPDMTEAYDRGLRQLADSVAEEQGTGLHHGIYLATSGPSFETPAEIRAFRVLGADAVGMSTVPECIVARHSGIKVLGISCITNAAAGMNKKPLSHEEVSETAAQIKIPFADLIDGIIRKL